MSSNKKLLSIFGFLGVLTGLVIVNMLFIKISKSVVEISKSSSLSQSSQVTKQKNADKEEKFEIDDNKKNILNTLIDDKIQQNSIVNENKPEIKVFLQLNDNIDQEIHFKQINDTIKERYPDFPSLDINPPIKKNPNQIPPIIERNVSISEIKNQSITDQPNNQTINRISNTNGTLVSDNKTISVEVLNSKKNSTTVIISENKTVIIDIPNELSNLTFGINSNPKSSNTTLENSNLNISKSEENSVNKNETIISKNTTTKPTQNDANINAINITNVNVKNKNVTNVNITNINITQDSCDFNDENDDFDNKIIGDENKNEKEEHSKYKKNKKDGKKKKHGKRCKNKKHVHYIESSKGEVNLLPENLNPNDIHNSKIVDILSGSSYTEAALTKLIVVDHTQTPKLEKSENVLIKEFKTTVENEIKNKQINLAFDDKTQLDK